MRRHEGIRTHMCMGVEPHPIHITSSKIPVKMEEGFTFEIPDDIKEKLRKTFLKACGLNEDGSKIEKQTSRVEDHNMKQPYKCAICGRENVKLWRPYMNTEPLVCATCAEERQTPLEYEEKTWEKKGDCYFGTPTGKMIPLPKWKVDDKGKIPSSLGPGHDGQISLTTLLIVNLKDVSASCRSGHTTIVPAVADEDGEFYGYSSVPQELCEWWDNLPTR